MSESDYVQLQPNDLLMITNCYTVWSPEMKGCILQVIAWYGARCLRCKVIWFATGRRPLTWTDDFVHVYVYECASVTKIEQSELVSCLTI